MIINKELDRILSNYVTKVSDFCKSYEKEVLGKDYSTYHNTIATIYVNFENKLWELKHEAQTAISDEISAAINNGGNIDDSVKLVKLGKSFEDDLWAMHKYYKYMYSGRIAKGLADAWIKAGNEAFFELAINKISSHKEYSHKGGHKV